jgi:hypothetical protein
MQAVLKIRGLERARPIVAIECNLGFEAQRQTDTLMEASRKGLIPAPIIMYEDGAGNQRPGIRTTNENKAAMVALFDKSLTRNRVFFHEKYVCTSANASDTPERMREEQVRQYDNFARIVIPTNNVHEPPKVIYSGKRGYGGGDDRTMADLINGYAWGLFKRGRIYQQFWEVV